MLEYSCIPPRLQHLGSKKRDHGPPPLFIFRCVAHWWRKPRTRVAHAEKYKSNHVHPPVFGFRISEDESAKRWLVLGGGEANQTRSNYSQLRRSPQIGSRQPSVLGRQSDQTCWIQPSRVRGRQQRPFYYICGGSAMLPSPGLPACLLGTELFLEIMIETGLPVVAFQVHEARRPK